MKEGYDLERGRPRGGHRRKMGWKVQIKTAHQIAPSCPYMALD